MPVRLWTTTKIGKIASLPNSVKAVLSENKQVISVAFTALIQTLTSDPQMINIIYKNTDCEWSNYNLLLLSKNMLNY